MSGGYTPGHQGATAKGSLVVSEREEVIAWLTGEVGWSLRKIENRTGGRSVYHFWEGDTNGWNTVHKYRADDLRWRHMIGVGLSYIPELRAKRDAIWAGYLEDRAKARGQA